MANNITELLNKAERRLGLRQINLPKDLGKDSWAKIIEEDTIATWSRFYPHKIRVKLGPEFKKEGYYFLDKVIPPGCKVIGIKDIGWDEYSTNGSAPGQSMGYGVYDYLAGGLDLAQVMLSQAAADVQSLFSIGIYPDFVAPNKIRLVNVYNQEVTGLSNYFPIDVFLAHNINLSTISPTQMEKFEQLAIADIATFLYEELKYYDGLETIFANVDLHLDTLQNWSSRREDIIKELEEAYVSAGNENQPIIMTIN